MRLYRYTGIGCRCRLLLLDRLFIEGSLLLGMNMHSPSLRRFATAVCYAVVAAGGLGVSSAQAQFHHDAIQNNMIAHAQQMNDYAYMASQNYANSQGYEEESDNGYYGSSAPPAPLTLEQQYLIEARQRDEEIMDELRADPRFERYVNGGWDHYQSRQPAEAGEYCAATYLSRNGIITLTGLDKSWDGGMLLFIGEKIPKPDTLREVTATLTQSGGPPAMVKVYNFARDPLMEELGTLAFAVPSMPDAMGGMEDDIEFVIEIEGQQVFRMSWKDGLKARDELRKCVRRR